MKTLGLIGGVSWESTAEYYRLLNEGVKARLGSSHSARLLLLSLDFQPVEEMQNRGDWASITTLMTDSAQQLAAGGAEGLIICSNTLHRNADEIAQAVGLPLIHIGDSTAAAINRAGLKTVGLLGTRFTMEQPFLKSRLESHGLSVMIPSDKDREKVHSVIYNELILGRIEDSSRRAYLEIISRLQADGAEGAVLGCTEIPLLVRDSDTSVPLFDTTALHVQSALDWALAP